MASHNAPRQCAVVRRRSLLALKQTKNELLVIANAAQHLAHDDKLVADRQRRRRG